MPKNVIFFQIKIYSKNMNWGVWTLFLWKPINPALFNKHICILGWEIKIFSKLNKMICRFFSVGFGFFVEFCLNPGLENFYQSLREKRWGLFTFLKKSVPLCRRFIKRRPVFVKSLYKVDWRKTKRIENKCHAASLLSSSAIGHFSRINDILHGAINGKRQLIWSSAESCLMGY